MCVVVWDMLYLLHKELQKVQKENLCIDGDGALTMHMGSLSTSEKFNNLVHIVLIILAESVGGHDNAAKHVKFYELAKFLDIKILWLQK